MSKPALGRGLGKLLGGSFPKSPTSDSAQKAPVMTPGVRTLFRGGKKEQDGQGLAEGDRKHPVKHKRLIKGSLMAADLVILSLVAWVLLGSGRPLTILEILFSASAIILGGWLACLALYLD